LNPLDELFTPRLRLSRMRATDLDDLTRMHLDPHVMATMAGVRPPAETAQWLARQLDHWQQYGFGLWMAHDRVSGQFLGRGGLHHVEIGGHDEIEVGYCFLSEFWGRGLATERACASVSAAFDVLHLTELVCFTLPINLASQRVMQKAGFRYERSGMHKDLPHVFYRLTAAMRGTQSDAFTT
jgi:RimJ/RimL family protein N-acetyltransferase